MSKAIRLVTSIPGPRSARILERKAKVVCDPLDIHVPAVIDHGEGATVTDVDGNTFLDFSGGLGCQLVGYSHPKVVEAVQKQAARASHTDFSVIPYEAYVELAERLVSLTGGGARKVALFNSGAEAVERFASREIRLTQQPMRGLVRDFASIALWQRQAEAAHLDRRPPAGMPAGRRRSAGYLVTHCPRPLPSLARAAANA